MRRLTDALDTIPPRQALAGAALLVVAIGILDYLTGDYSVADLYLMACFLASWCTGAWAGLAVAGFCAAAMFTSDYLLGFSQPAHVWNRAIESSALAVAGLLASALQRSNAALRDLARRDNLTGLDNRGAFLARLEVELAVSRRDGRPLTIAFLDLDDFKALNDARGHAEGDRALRAVSRVLKRRTRAADACARFGGDEFTLLLREADAGVAINALNQFREELRAEMVQHGWGVGASMGAVTLYRFAGDAAEALRLADRLLYEAKRAGKGLLRHEER